MCATCGCGQGESQIEGIDAEHAHRHVHAAANRQRFAAHGIHALNLVSSPGSGKTTLLVKTIEMLGGRLPISVIEGEDKPLKYPDMFHAARLMLLNKCDLLPHLDFDVAQAIEFAQRINPTLTVIQTSATSGAGMTEWLAWLERGAAAACRPNS